MTNMRELAVIALFYAGPDQLLPVLSALGAIIGVLLMWWQRFVGLFFKVARSVHKRLGPSAGKQEP